MRWARLLLLALSTTWLVLLLTAPAVASGVPLSAATYALGSLICHQRPERSFHLAAAQLPVCARCFGLYVGAAAGLLVGIWLNARSDDRLRAVLVAAALPTAVSWGSEMLGVWAPANATRFLAAVPLGAAVALTVNYLECVRPPRIESKPPRTPI